LQLGLAEFDDTKNEWDRSAELRITIPQSVELGGDPAGFDGPLRVVFVLQAFERPSEKHGWIGTPVMQEVPIRPARQNRQRAGGAQDGPFECLDQNQSGTELARC